MLAFARLLDRLSLEPRRRAKEAILVRYFLETPDPDRGYALAALTGELTFKHAKPAVLRGLISERTDPQLFALSYDFVGDLSETISLMWPSSEDAVETSVSGALRLSDVVERLETTGKTEVPNLLADWLDRLDETGRWALLKLITGGLRVGVSSRLAKTAVAGLGDLKVSDVEENWHGQKPPYQELFAWAEGRAPRPENSDPVPFRPVMLAHPFDQQKDRAALKALDYALEWKWDGIRVQASSGLTETGERVSRLYSRTGDDISRAFPDVLAALDFDGCIDGELLVIREGRVQPFSDLQKRLNRKTAGPKLLKEFPAAIRMYDALFWNGEDLRDMPFRERRQRLEALARGFETDRIDLSPLINVQTWQGAEEARADPAALMKTEDAGAVEGLMLKRWDSAYVSGRPKGPWFKWKRDPRLIDAVLMYAQRGHGKRSSLYSDFTFGVWRDGEDGQELVPVGKAYFGFTDAELADIDKFVRTNTLNRFGPVREVAHGIDKGLVLEVAFEGLNASPRHKSGIAMRFPRISRLRWDKPPAEADRLETLLEMLPVRAGT